MYVETLRKKYEDLDLSEELCEFRLSLLNEYRNYVLDDKYHLLVFFLDKELFKISDLNFENFPEFLKSAAESFLFLKNRNEEILKDYENIWPVVVLYLVFLKKYIEFFANNIFEKHLDLNSVEYALNLLGYVDIFDLRNFLEDKLFAYLEPETFNHYESILQFSKETYIEHEKKVKKKLQDLLDKNLVCAVLESRVKTIYSIHKKIIRKNLLFSQVLDTVGIRMIVESSQTCYFLMQLILKSFTVLNTKVKDYIMVPKSNGYKSLHVTVLIYDAPVEIQIRTQDMHALACFGSAAHRIYAYEKNEK